jgi:hypothetical protein
MPKQRTKCQGQRHNSGCKGIGIELHICPYQSEINDDNDTLCNCCDICRSECRDDV